MDRWGPERVVVQLAVSRALLPDKETAKGGHPTFRKFNTPQSHEIAIYKCLVTYLIERAIAAPSQECREPVFAVCEAQ